jgi:hypothetical protein
MRIILMLMMFGMFIIPKSGHAGSATLYIKVKIISKADWDKINNNDDVTIDNYDDSPETFEFAENIIPASVYLDDAAEEEMPDFVEPYSYQDLEPDSKFALMDMNGDRFVTRREYLISTGTPINNSDFNEYDRDRDGFITIAEMR